MKLHSVSPIKIGLAILTSLALFFPLLSLADEMPQILYSHVDQASLPQDQVNQIVAEQPPTEVPQDSTILLVYQKQNNCAPLVKTSERPKQSLPNTGDSLSLLGLAGFILIGMTFVLWKNRKTRIALILLLTSAGLIMPSVLADTLATLLPDTRHTSGQAFTPEAISCYTYVGFITPSAPTPAPAKGTVVVKYVNEAGESIQEDAIDSENASIGTAYDTSDLKPNRITTTDGKVYQYSRVEGQETGKVVEGTTTVTYVYTEIKGKVIVQYVDLTSQTTLATDPAIEKSIGSSYTTKPIQIASFNSQGYYLVSDSGNTSGTIIEDTITVTYYLKKNSQVLPGEGDDGETSV